MYTDTACRVGCGRAECGGGSNKIHVCSFAFGPDFKFKEGPACADCPNTCSNNLCGEWIFKVTFEYFRIVFYGIYRICRKLFLVVLKMKITKDGLLQIR